MSLNALKLLATEEFVASLGACGTAVSLRRCLQRSEYVKAVRRALSCGEITEATLRNYVRDVMRSWKPGVQFPYDFALAALAVVLEKRYTPFVDEFLLDLARLHGIAEIEYAPKVAQACRKQWGKRRAQVVERTRRFVTGAIAIGLAPDFWVLRNRESKRRGATDAVLFKAKMSNA